MATILKGNTGMEQKINKTKKQLNIYQKLQGKEKLINIIVDVFVTVISFLLLYIVHPALGLIGGGIGYAVSYYVIDKTLIVSWINSKVRDRYFYLEYLMNKQNGENLINKTLTDNMNKDFYLINGARFETEDNNVIRIPHVMLCPDGTIVCIESHNLKGTFSMGNKDWRRKLQTDNGQYIYENDFMDMRTKSYKSARNLHLMFGKKLKKHKIVSLVVMANKESNWEGKQESFCPIIRLNQLSRFLNHHYGQKQLEKEENERSAMMLWSKTISKAS